MKAAFFTLIMLIATTGCSTQYRSTDPQVSSDELMQWLGEATSNTQSLSAGTLANDPNTGIYFADSSIGTMGNVRTVLAFDNINFVDPAISVDSVINARIFFLDNPGDGTNRQDSLIVGIMANGSSDFQYYTFDGQGNFDSGMFDMAFNGSDGLTYHARTYDVDGDKLNSDIQLKIYSTDSDGNEIYVGKFSALAGFQ